MSREIELFWVRHGETQWNVDRRCQGQLNPPLNEKGFHQARLLAARLALEEPFDVLVCSDLARAKQTAQLISQAIGLPITSFYEELRERYMGWVHGLTAPEAESAYGPTWREQDLGRESIETLRARAKRATERIIKEHGHHKRILVTSHGGIITSFMHVYGLPVEENLQNTSITRAIYSEDGTWKLRSFNDARHLDETA